MSNRIWPANGDKERWPIYRGSDGHLRDGQGEGTDFGNQLGLPVLALADGDYVTLMNLPDCGNTILLHLLDDNTYHTFCHLDRHAPSTDDCTAGQVLGWVGWTGLVRPPSPLGSHLHWWIWQPGVGRIRPEDYIAQHTWEKPEDDTMTEEQRVVYEIGLRAQRDLPNVANVTRGWGNWLLSTAPAGRKKRDQGGRELVDTSVAMGNILVPPVEE